MQMIPVHEKPNKFCPVENKTDFHPVGQAVFASSSKFNSAFLIAYIKNWTLALPLN